MKIQIDRWRGYPGVALLAVLFAMSSACQAQSNKATDVNSVVEAFYGAITAGNADAAMALIAPDAIFIESGNIENRDQYQKNHLPRDIEYESEVKGERGPLKVTQEGNTAWVISTTKYDETDQGNPDLYIITQLMVLTRSADGWRIRSICWSSNQV
ncbi:MAG TPA: nuclear transport factor 2 family protein [Gammaproteobacteria bacterium]|nr:nuclear transport factor 2 family protein [Gammaproteobacteria bacterium]